MTRPNQRLNTPSTRARRARPARASSLAHGSHPTSIALALVSLLAIGAACSTSPRITYHTLGVVVSGQVAAMHGAVGEIKTLGVGPVFLPTLLEQPGVVVRRDAYTVELSETHEWAGKLEDELLRALARYLQLRLPEVQVLRVPWETAQTPQVQVALSLDQFDGSPGGEAVLRGTWFLQDPEDGRALATHRVSMQEPVKGKEVRDVVEAQAQLVMRLGKQVVEQLGSGVRPAPES